MALYNNNCVESYLKNENWFFCLDILKESLNDLPEESEDAVHSWIESAHSGSMGDNVAVPYDGRQF